MKLSQLKQLVDQAVEMCDDDEDPTVKIAHQPNYPLAASLRDVVLNDERDVSPEEREDDHFPDDDIVWLVAGESTDYAPRDLWERWS